MNAPSARLCNLLIGNLISRCGVPMSRGGLSPGMNYNCWLRSRPRRNASKKSERDSVDPRRLIMSPSQEIYSL